LLRAPHGHPSSRYKQNHQTNFLETSPRPLADPLLE
jgi:hypothetical protein